MNSFKDLSGGTEENRMMSVYSVLSWAVIIVLFGFSIQSLPDQSRSTSLSLMFL
jgi:hypothetical protein